MGKNSTSFVKGDPRVNRKGRPKNIDGVTALAKEIAHELALTKDGDPIVRGGSKVTVIEAVLRQWAQSPDFRKQQAFVAYAYGKVPDKIEHTGEDGKAIKLVVEYVNKRKD